MNDSGKELDARNLLCPLPVIRTQDFVKNLESGDEFVVRCTDPGAKSDIPSWCRINGHKVIDIQQSEYEVLIKIQVIK